MNRIIFVVFAVLPICFGLPYTASHLVPTLDGRIVGGDDADITKYPYQLSLMYGSRHICGASIIHPDWAVTAAHCTDGAVASDLSVRAGSSVLGTGGQVINVKRIHQHSNYSSDIIDYDISILELATSIVLNQSALPIQLPKSHAKIRVNSTAVITGWGTTTEQGSVSKHLQVVFVPVVSRTVCKRAYGSGAITDRMFCAGISGIGGKDACQGDSGGPLVVDGVLTGIVSWGYGCARPDYPGVYSKVSILRDFIKRITSL